MKVRVVVVGKRVALTHLANSDHSDSEGLVLGLSHV